MTTKYERDIQNRTRWHYIKGLLARWKQHFKYDRAVRIARRRGATIGEGVIMPLSLAKKANSNFVVGDHVSIQTDKIDLRSPVKIGSHVIIGSGTKIITTSHNIDSANFEAKYYGITISDFVWIPTDVMILPSCRDIGYGAVIGSGSVVVKNVPELAVMTGNPARKLKDCQNVHTDLCVESLLGGDYHLYKHARNNGKSNN